MSKYILKKEYENFYAGGRTIYTKGIEYSEKEIPNFAKEYFECKEETESKEVEQDAGEQEELEEEESVEDNVEPNNENSRRNKRRRG